MTDRLPVSPAGATAAAGEQTHVPNASPPVCASLPSSVRLQLFRTLWITTNALLAIAILTMICASGWEYSTNRYLAGFADAIVPASQSAEGRIQAILDWMASGPARQSGDPSGLTANRDPIETLNYRSLLRVCGTATNAFINLADSSGLRARRLLLLDSRQETKHVVAEVFVNDRWIVVDPAFRAILRGGNGQGLTREDLQDPAVFAMTTRNIHGYDKSYTYERTGHIHLARLGATAPLLRKLLDDLAPGWANSPILSLMVERESLVVLILAVLLVLSFVGLRIALQIYAERRLKIPTVHFRTQIVRAYRAFVSSTG